MQPLPFKQGLSWFLAALVVIRRYHLTYLGMVMFYVLISVLLSSVPLVGGILAGIWMPFGTLLLVYATKQTLEGRLPTYDLFFSLFRKLAVRDLDFLLLWERCLQGVRSRRNSADPRLSDALGCL